MISYNAEGVAMPNIKRRATTAWIKAVAATYGKRVGEIGLVISLDTVRSNAELFGRPYEEELHRVIIHGVLHLCGLNDKGPGERELMEDAENRALALLKTE